MHGPSDIMRHERWQWAMVQKQERGLYLLDAHLKHDMARQNVKPNIWVFPPKMSIYATMVPNAETEYRMRGPKAATNLDADRYTLPSFRGCKVVESNSFDVDFTGQPINLLERNRQIGEFFIMEEGKDIMIYDAGKDGWAKISWENAKSAAYGSEENTGYIAVFRPHATWTMSSAILAEGGKKLGATFHGKHDMVLQTDAVRKFSDLFAFFAFYFIRLHLNLFLSTGKIYMGNYR